MIEDQKQSLVELIGRAAAQLGASDVAVRLERPKQAEHGDLATNVAMQLARTLKKNPRQIAEELVAAMKADGVEYEERLERLAEVTYPKPLEELLDRAFELYCQGVPWARDYFAEHNEIRLDGDARSAAYLSIDESPEAEQHLWHVRQIFLGENADGDFRIEADVNLDATQEEGEVIFKNYRVGFVEDLAE